MTPGVIVVHPIQDTEPPVDVPLTAIAFARPSRQVPGRAELHLTDGSLFILSENVTQLRELLAAAIRETEAGRLVTVLEVQLPQLVAMLGALEGIAADQVRLHYGDGKP